MLKLSEFSHNHQPSGVKLLAKKYQTWNFGIRRSVNSKLVNNFLFSFPAGGNNERQ